MNLCNRGFAVFGANGIPIGYESHVSAPESASTPAITGPILSAESKAANHCRLGIPDTATQGRWLGLELEVLPARATPKRAFGDMLYAALDAAGLKNAVLVKEDASLRTGYEATDESYENLEGLELVSGVMSLEYARTANWDRLLAELGSRCYMGPSLSRSASGTAGMHVHANVRWADVPDVEAFKAVAYTVLHTAPLTEVYRVFGRISSYAKPERTLRVYTGRLEQLVHRYVYSKDILVEKLSLRTLRRLPQRIRQGFRMRNRYSLVNITNENTIEFRGFAEPWNGAQVRASMELVAAVMDFAHLAVTGGLRCKRAHYTDFRQWADAQDRAQDILRRGFWGLE